MHSIFLCKMQTLYLILFLIFAVSNADQKWENIQTSTPLDIQTKEAEKLIHRLLPDHSNLINIKILGPSFAPKNQDKVSLITENVSSNDIAHFNLSSKKILNVTANTGVAAIWGINHYLKYFFHSHISWDTTRIGKLK